MNISWIAALVKGVGAVCLTFVILWHFVPHAGPQRGKAIVHVPQPDVMVEVDEQRYHVGSMEESPVVCEVEPGHHLAIVRGSGKLLWAGSFVVEAGEEVEVHADIRRASAAAKGQRPLPAQEVKPASLAVQSGRS
jgi:hypothetical protein